MKNKLIEELTAEKRHSRELEKYILQLEERVELLEDYLTEAGYVKAYAEDEEIWVKAQREASFDSEE